jgi:hypothetical protein
MLALHDADAEAITGGRHRHSHHQLTNRHSRGGSSLRNNITFAPQINIAVNLVAFGGSITNIQGNAGFAFA